MVDLVIFAEKRRFARRELHEFHYQISQFFCYPVSTHLTFEGVDCGSATQILVFVNFDELGIVIHSDQLIASFPFEDVSRYIPRPTAGRVFSLVLAFRRVVYSGTYYTLCNHSRDFQFVASSLARIALPALAACIS